MRLRLMEGQGARDLSRSGDPRRRHRLSTGIMHRWDAGYSHTRAGFERAPWIGEFDPLSGVILHVQMELAPVAAD
jgi:NTE family protein